MANNSEKLSFRVSSGLKNIIGRDLISDKYIAIFELVKNSYDALAHNVTITFSADAENKPTITIADDGIGMNYSDITEKWLFVAYSEKKKQNRKESDYRNEFKRNIAGAKGVGRFSCDRLGAKLRLITKTESEGIAHYVDIDWNDFEYDDHREFINIPVNYHTDSFPANYSHGAILEISDLREDWDRAAIIHLKKSLMKLISPDLHNNGDDKFEITISAAAELDKDNALRSKGNVAARDLVNGIIVNDVFEKLNIKTTNLTLDISEDGKEISTILSDRGQRIFEIVERNTKYVLLKNIHISLFYLNRIAKTNFTRLMGIEPVNYGSVFIYKNGFRVNPYGEPNEDVFGIDKRKGQGYNRFLGTREIMGRISISGDNEGFIETTSRAHGFIQTEEVDSLSDLFLQKVLKVLERYVVNVISWNNPIKTEHEIAPAEVADKILAEFADYSSRNDIISIKYDEDLFVQNSGMNSDSLSTSLRKLQKVAEKTNNESIYGLIDAVKKQTDAIKKQNLELEQDNRQKEGDLKKAKESEAIKDKQIFFLKGATNNSVTNLINGMHVVFTQSEAIRGNLDLLEETVGSAIINYAELAELVREIKKSNNKINKLAELAIHGGQNLKAEFSQDIRTFIEEYLGSELTVKGVSTEIESDTNPYLCFFDSASFGLIIDNLFSNSVKAHADKMIIRLQRKEKHIEIGFYDNGIGLASNIDPKTMFEYGATTTDRSKHRGFGVGLSHIKQLACDMGGDVEYDAGYTVGFGMIVRLKK